MSNADQPPSVFRHFQMNSTELNNGSTEPMFTGLDYCIFAIILSASMAIGIYFGFFSKSLKTAEDYLVGGHKLKTFPVAVSLMAR